MLKNNLIDLLKIYDKTLTIKIYTFDPDNLWHETDEFDLEMDSIYRMESDDYQDIISLDISSVYKKQTVGSLLKQLSQYKQNIDVCLLKYDEYSNSEHQFDYISNFALEIKENYILIT